MEIICKGAGSGCNYPGGERILWSILTALVVNICARTKEGFFYFYEFETWGSYMAVFMENIYVH